MEPGTGQVTGYFVSKLDNESFFQVITNKVRTLECSTTQGITIFGMLSEGDELPAAVGQEFIGRVTWESGQSYALNLHLNKVVLIRNPDDSVKQEFIFKVLGAALEKDMKQVEGKVFDYVMSRRSGMVGKLEALTAPIQALVNEVPAFLTDRTERAEMSEANVIIEDHLDNMPALSDDILGKLVADDVDVVDETPSARPETFGGLPGVSEVGLFVVKLENETDEEYRTRKAGLMAQMAEAKTAKRDIEADYDEKSVDKWCTKMAEQKAVAESNE